MDTLISRSEELINRSEELRLIDEVVDTLLNSQRLLRTPIIEFYGIEGIGKTTLLKKVEERCQEKSLPAIWADVAETSSLQFLKSTRELLEERKPVAVIVDSLDATSKENLHDIERGLRDLIENPHLLVVLASKSFYRFEMSRSIVRKLTSFHLLPFDYDSCVKYLDHFGGKISPKTRDIIYEWTRGYPLAMNVMVEAIQKEMLNPSKERDRNKILDIIIEKVIRQTLLSKVSSLDDRIRFERLLTLFSVPRRFNLVIMQDLIERYANEYKSESTLAYITLPAEINAITGVLNWDMAKAGYSIDAPVRNILLNKLKIEQSAEYISIHRFLAERNHTFAQEVSGPDRIRYIREFFYHLANSDEGEYITSALIENLEQVLKEDRPDYFLQFYEEFLRDGELRAALGENTHIVFTFISKIFIDIYKHLLTESSGDERVRYVRAFFSYTVATSGEDFPLILEQGLHQIIQEQPFEVSRQLFNELTQDQELKASLEKDFNRIESLFGNISQEER